MKHLTVRNFGPITEAELELKRYNLFIGQQSSGKSTLLKIASFCDWLEAQVEMTQSPERYERLETIKLGLIRFHKMEGYLRANSYIKYETDALSYEFDATLNNATISWGRGNRRWAYKRAKIAYIPAERNLVAAIPNWFQVSMSPNNIFDFMKDWEFARKAFDKKEQILGLPFSYRYDAETKSDEILMEDGHKVSLTNASSGLQSLTPLFIMLRYLTKNYFNDDHGNVENIVLKERLQNILMTSGISESKRDEILQNFMSPSRTDLFIEEPEAHLFPSTQKDFVYALVKMLNGRKKHNCFISTHSPYLMTAFNNLIMAGTVASESKEKADIVSRRFASSMRLKYDDVAAYSIKDGKSSCIMDEEFRLISADALDAASETISNDFDFLLNL